MLYFLYFQRRNQRPTPDMRVVANKIPLASNKTEEFTARYFARRELKLPSSTRENRTTSCCIRGQETHSWYFTGRANKIPSVAANPRKYRNEFHADFGREKLFDSPKIKANRNVSGYGTEC